MRTQNTTNGAAACPMCGQPLADQHSIERVADYEKRTEAQLRKKLEPRAMAAAEGKYGKRLAQATQEAEDLRRKLEAKSARVLGEEQQDELFQRLRRAFPEDHLELVGDNGTGDVLQTVYAERREVGRILHECKNTRQWQGAWVERIRRDGKLRRATHLIIESRKLPSGVRGFCQVNGVLVCQPDYALALTHVLRLWMISACAQDGVAVDENELWEYLRGEKFGERLGALRRATKVESAALLAEERAHHRWWDARASRARTVGGAVAGIEGDLQDLSAQSDPKAGAHGPTSPPPSTPEPRPSAVADVVRTT
jgi:hypothetical protein